MRIIHRKQAVFQLNQFELINENWFDFISRSHQTAAGCAAEICAIEKQKHFVWIFSERYLKAR